MKSSKTSRFFSQRKRRITSTLLKLEVKNDEEKKETQRIEEMKIQNNNSFRSSSILVKCCCSRTSKQLVFTLFTLTTLIQTTYSDNSGLWASDAQTTVRYLPSSSSSFSHPSTSSIVQKRDLNSPNSKQQLNGSSSSNSRSRACQVISGESVAIVEIEESRGTDFLQLTNPPELPISGSSGDIELKIESETHKYFQIHDKTLRLIRPLDRDAVLKQQQNANGSLQIQQQPISSIYLQISCLDRRAKGGGELKKVIIPVLVKVLDLNDNEPKFSAQTYTVQVDELTPVNSIIFDQIQAIDLDSANNGLIEYSLAQPMSLPSRQNSLHPIQPQTKPPFIDSSNTYQPSSPSDSISLLSSTRSSVVNNIQGDQFTGVSASSQAPKIERLVSEPTINLDSEPIVNGPIESGDSDEDSDEALLAAMNSTTDSLSPDLESELSFQSGSDESPLMMNADYSVVRRIKRSSPTNKPAARRAQSELWTDILGSSDDHITLNAGNSQLEPSIIPYPSRGEDLELLDSTELFSLELAPQTGRPIIRLKRQLDYETRRVHQITILASDKATNKNDRLTSSARLIVRVLDGDDQGPAFILDQTGCATSSLPQTTPSGLTTLLTTNTPDLHPVSFSTSSAQVSPYARSRRSTSAAPASNKLSTTVSDDDSSSSSTTTMAADLNIKQHHLPKGFKVTEENFDFSDSLGPVNSADFGEEASYPHNPNDESASSDDATRSAPLRARHLLLLPPPAGLNSSSNSQLNNQAKQLDPYSCLVGHPFSSSSQPGQAEYFASVMSGHSDYLLRIAPQAIRARDRDELNAPIRYSFINGTPSNYSSYFVINPLDATIKQIAPLERQFIPRLEIWVQAQEQSVNRLASLAKLSIEVIASDRSPPILLPNSYAGFVEENSAVGTSVSISKWSRFPAETMRIRVIDADLMVAEKKGTTSSTEQTSKLLYEFETTSEAFKVNRDGLVYVNKWPLDRDPPQQAVHIFQVTARQIGLASSRSVSSPISVNVTLLDLNDNPPVIANSSLLPVQLTASGIGQANSAMARHVTTIKALDPDEGENSRAHFSLVHVSNGGRDRFRISPDSGDLEAIGRFQSGEQFSLTVQVTDLLGRTNQGILELEVVPGPNTGGPQFVQSSGELPTDLRQSSGYSVELSEGVPVHSPVLQLRAVDPENDPISYSIIDGNVNEDFYVNSKSGTLYVGKRLDREEVSAYNLIVQARDSGGLASARTVSILITDINDQNPNFSSQNYTFFVDEGVSSVGKVIGKVQASDGDSGENGRISYQLEATSAISLDTGNQLFSINEQTGEIKLEEALDYERLKSHALVVSARDQGETPRTSTCSVLVRVRDLQDEAPYFERYYAEVRIVENAHEQRLIQVQARDPDSASEITYVLRQGDPFLFSLDAKTGQLSTTVRGLDFEESRKYTVLIGLLENGLGSRDLGDVSREISDSLSSGLPLNKSPVFRVDILVQDLNDNPPQFINQPLPVRVQDTAQLGTLVSTVNAHDADGSEPNNQLRYELITAESSLRTDDHQSPIASTSERCARSFMLDPTSGAVSVKSDLKRDSQSECNLLIRAKDLGQLPGPLSSISQLTIYIDHIAEISTPNSMVGFADSQFTVEFEENAPANSLVKVLPIVNKPKQLASSNFPLSCEILSGNEQGKFYVHFDSEHQDCELRTSRDPSHQLDYEQKQRYSLTLRLNTIGGSSSLPGRNLLAQVNVNLIDVNDNKPVFQQVTRYSHLTQNKFLAAIASDAPSETQVLQLRASDTDSSHSNGLISYELLNEHELEGRFKVEPVDGIIRTSRPVEDVQSNKLPLKLKVMARDNPESASSSLNSVAEVFVNLIDDNYRVALVLKDSPTARVLDSKEEILGAIQERTGLISGLEKAESLKIQRNGTLEPDVTGTDFWFYLIEPGTFRIVSSDDTRVKSSLFDGRARTSLLDILSQSLGFTKARIRLPYSMNGLQARTAGVLSRSGHPAYGGGANGQTLGSGLIWFALTIAIISAIVIIYQCGSWSSYSSKEKQIHKQLRANNLSASNYYQPAGQPTFPSSKMGPAGQFVDPTSNYALRSAFSTLSNQQQHQQQQRNSKQHSLLSGEYPPSNLYHQQQVDGNGIPLIPSNNLASFGKEYETQMLKMSVLFDDAHSVDEQNLNIMDMNHNKSTH